MNNTTIEVIDLDEKIHLINVSKELANSYIRQEEILDWNKGYFDKDLYNNLLNTIELNVRAHFNNNEIQISDTYKSDEHLLKVFIIE